MKNEDIEKIFRQDSIGKKRIGINVTKRASRRGYVRGGVRTQSDFLTAKQKRALNGEVKIMDNIYKDINKLSHALLRVVPQYAFINNTSKRDVRNRKQQWEQTERNRSERTL